MLWVVGLALLLSLRWPLPDGGPPQVVSSVVVRGWLLLVLPAVVASFWLAYRLGPASRPRPVVLAGLGLLVAFVGLPATAFVASCDDHRDNYVAGLAPAERPGTVWTATTSERPGLFETVTVACGLSPEGSVDEDFDRTNHEIGLAGTAHRFLSTNLWGVIEREPIRRVAGPLASPPLARSGPTLGGLALLGRILVFLAVALLIRGRFVSSQRSGRRSGQRPGQRALSTD